MNKVYYILASVLLVSCIGYGAQTGGPYDKIRTRTMTIQADGVTPTGNFEVNADLDMQANSIIDVNLVDGRDISADGTQLDSNTTAIGAPLSTPVNYTATDAQVIKDHLDGIDTALGGLGGSANTSLSNLTSPTAVNQDLRPGIDDTYFLGSSSFHWTGLYTPYVANLLGTQLIMESNAGIFIDPDANGVGDEPLDVEGHIQIRNNKTLRLMDADNSNYVSFKSPAVVASNLDLIVPDVDGLNGDVLTTNGAGVLSFTTPATSFVDQFQMENAGIASSVTSNALTVSLKQDDGSSDPTAGSPAKIAFRSSTATSGAYNLRSVTSALSLTVPVGATLGHLANAERDVYVYLIDNAGTVEIGVSSSFLDEKDLQTTATIAGTSDDAGFYSDAIYSNVPIRLLGRFKSTQSTAGNWAAAMSKADLGKHIDRNSDKVMAAVSLTVNQTIASTAETQINWTAIDKDPRTIYDTTNDYFQIPRDGFYVITANIVTTGLNGNEDMIYKIRLVGVQSLAVERQDDNANNTSASLVWVGPLNEGDQVDVTSDSQADASYDISTVSSFTIIEM